MNDTNYSCFIYACLFYTPEQQLSQFIKLVIYRKFQFYSYKYGICQYSNGIFCLPVSASKIRTTKQIDNEFDLMVWMH